MKTSLKISLVLALGSSILFAGSNQYKMYGVESGKIDYKITGSGNILGVKTKTVGKKRVLFKDYGAKSLTEENQVQKTDMGGNANVEKSHKITILDDAILYNVDLEKKRIMRMQNPAMAMMSAMGSDKSPLEMGEAMLKKMGGKKTGTDKVLGYTCDMWEAMGTKQCIYKGIPLKIETDMMGTKQTEVATKAEFDISIPDDSFKLPDFPAYDMYGQKLDKSSLTTLDAKEKKEAAQAAEALAATMGAMAAAAQSAGVKPGEKPSKAQEKDMENAMMAALLPRMKQKALAEEKVFLSAKECFGKADTLEEAKVCSDKMDEMSGESADPEDELAKWDDKTKKETLGFIDQGLKNITCIRKAQTMDVVKKCMSQE